MSRHLLEPDDDAPTGGVWLSLFLVAAAVVSLTLCFYGVGWAGGSR